MAAPESAESRQLAELAENLGKSLGDLLLGLYVHGSTARGQPHFSSDLDVLAIVTTSLGPTARGGLADLLLRQSGRHPRDPGTRRPVELTVVSQHDVRPWRYPPRVDFQYGEWLREAIHNGVLPQPHNSPDLAVVLADVLAHGMTLVGPPAGQLLERVPAADLVAATRAGVPQLLAELDSDTTNVLLTLARAWHTADTGRLVSKDEAAAWALAREAPEERPVLTHARLVYLDEVQEDWEPLRQLIRPTAEYLAARIA